MHAQMQTTFVAFADKKQSEEKSKEGI